MYQAPIFGVVALTMLIAPLQGGGVEIAPRSEPWLATPIPLESPAPPADPTDDLRQLKALIANRTPDQVERSRWWITGGPGYRWNELTLETLLDDMVTMPMAARHLALVHAAMDDAVAAAAREKQRYKRARPSTVDRSIDAIVGVPASPSYPSDYAAAAIAAATVLGEFLPGRAQALVARAEEAMQATILAGLEYPSDVAAGRVLGRAAAALAIARAKADGADAKWTGTVPTGAGRWQGTNPIAPMAGTWKPWLLARSDEIRPPPPPALDSERARTDLAELKAFNRTPRSNNRAIYQEVFGGARVHVLWNGTLRTKLLEYGDSFDAAAATRAMAALNIALADAGLACWDAKYAYWFIRPSQVDPELRPLFPLPNHPSFPSAHSCFSTAAANVLVALFPRDRERLLAMAREASEARLWAGIHFRFDIEAGEEIGRQVAERALARAFVR